MHSLHLLSYTSGLEGFLKNIKYKTIAYSTSVTDTVLLSFSMHHIPQDNLNGYSTIQIFLVLIYYKIILPFKLSC